MILQEPKIEFVPVNISQSIMTAMSTCPDGVVEEHGGGQYCIGSQEDAPYCPGWEGMVDWDDMGD